MGRMNWLARITRNRSLRNLRSHRKVVRDLGSLHFARCLDLLEDRTLLVAFPAPSLISFDRTNGASDTTNASTVDYTLTFSQSVSGVDPTDFRVVTSSGMVYSSVDVTPISGSVYKVSVTGTAGTGTVGLNFVDNNSVRNERGQFLQLNTTEFAAQQTYATGTSPQSVELDFIDSGSNIDLVVTNSGSNTVSVLLGNSNGTFQTQATFATGSAPKSAAVADVNADGNRDIIVANSGSNTVSVLLGNGDGTFQTQTTFAT